MSVTKIVTVVMSPSCRRRFDEVLDLGEDRSGWVYHR